MKKIGFIGAYDKTDVILSVAKVLAMASKKVLVIDDTITQKCKYVVPVINPTKSYVTTYENIDVAVGLDNFEKLRQYMGLEENENLEYDYVIVDTDSFEGVTRFALQSSEKIYYVTSFDMYSLKKGVEIISQLGVPTRMTRIFYTRYMLKEEEEYFNFLVLGSKAIWNEEKIYFILENGDWSEIMENQRLNEIKLRNLSNEYRNNIEFLAKDIDEEIDKREIRNIIKSL